jgi:hypothetical protein
MSQTPEQKHNLDEFAEWLFGYGRYADNADNAEAAPPVCKPS